MDKPSKIEIIEIFMAKAGKTGWDRCFHGTIKRQVDGEGNPVCYGKIKVGDGFIYAMGKDQWELGEILDEMVLLVLEMGLNADVCVSTQILSSKFNLN